MNNLFGLRTLGPNIKVVIWPLLSLCVLSVLIFMVFKEGFLRTKLLMSELSIVQKNKATLEDRLSILTEVTEKLDKTDATVVALPEKNPALWVISQMRESATQNNILINQLREADSPEEKDGVTKTVLKAELSAEGLDKLFSLLEFMQHAAPISTFEQVAIDLGEGNLVNAEVKVNVYWADFPAELVPLDKPIVGLSEKDTQVLSQISGMTLPRVTTLSPNPATLRENPFINTNI